jgi:hypothetical protein
MILWAMANAHSFVITLSNNRTEKEGLDVVLHSSPDLFHPDSIGRKKLLTILGLKIGYLKTFDLVRVSGANKNDKLLEIPNPKSVTLIELKTTKKRLPDNPYGFFFGATENEFNLAEALGKQFEFAFVCLHPETPSIKFCTLADLKLLIQKKRIQFQINLHRQR